MILLLFLSLAALAGPALAETQISLMHEAKSLEFIQWNPFTGDLSGQDEVYTLKARLSFSQKAVSPRQRFNQDRRQLLEGLEKTDWANHPNHEVRDLFLSKIIPQNPVKKLKELRLFFREHCFYRNAEVDTLLIRDKDFVCIRISREQIFFNAGWTRIASELLSLNVEEGKLFADHVSPGDPERDLSDEELTARAFSLSSPYPAILSSELKCHTETHEGAMLYRMTDVEWCRGQNRIHPDGRIIHQNGDLSVICGQYKK